MPKFKKDDYVILREDARYPVDGKLWSTVDKLLICGDLFQVCLIGDYEWSNTKRLDCVSLWDGSGWIPESCFDPVVIPEFEKSDLVECYRLPNEHNWEITKCGKIDHSFIVGAQYKINDVANNSNIKVGAVSDSWYPPTIFRKIKAQQLPENWCVACKHYATDTLELLEWRNSGWVGKGFIDNHKVWQYENGIKQIISYETFLELVYKPWKSIQPIVENPPPLVQYILPEKWVYSLENESTDRLILINEWRRSVCYKQFIKYDIKNSYSVCNHYDDSYFYSNSAFFYVKAHNGTIISKEMFDELILQPWIDNGKPSINVPDKKVPIESPPSLLLDPTIVTIPHIGARVVRGRDWDWGNQDGNGIGTIIDKNGEGWVRVTWDNNPYEASYRIGDNGKYDLYYYTEPIINLSAYYKEYPPDIMTTKNYSYSISESTTTSSSFPKLIVNKTKKRLLSTEVQEFNVNLNLLKTP
tara:strand:- start:4192 stop:5601 length:1410 start_codon:yes stop_codon:yes gene_type:complete